MHNYLMIFDFDNAKLLIDQCKHLTQPKFSIFCKGKILIIQCNTWDVIARILNFANKNQKMIFKIAQCRLP